MKTLIATGVFLSALFFGIPHGHFIGVKHHPHHLQRKFFQQGGKASFYACLTDADCPWGSDHLQGQPTASGVPMDSRKPMCASWRYPMHTWVIIENKSTHKSAKCQILDRGPNLWTHRIIDLSVAVKKAIGMGDGVGLAKVVVSATIKPHLVANAF